mmetsp:Transcript_3445/g.8182  ORF Transcript_3445/g.8182 Transcript_3445/m.8182 type:complete len:374 (+) Transcript_3445:332-1453(+)
MKFCKNLERVQTLSNPEWSPYWTDYKKLKKLIKRMTIDDQKPVDRCVDDSVVKAPLDPSPGDRRDGTMMDEERTAAEKLPSSSSSSSPYSRLGVDIIDSRSNQQWLEQQRGDSTTEKRVVACIRKPLPVSVKGHTGMDGKQQPTASKRRIIEFLGDPSDAKDERKATSRTITSRKMDPTVERRPQQQEHDQQAPAQAQQQGLPRQTIDCMKRNPTEVAFFKLLHSEFHKAVHFFDRAIDEYSIREERVRDGMEIIKQQHRGTLWIIFVRGVYRLYTDLLLLETYCIMTYCGFSKILKKHDKRTGLETKNAFMSNIVNGANFTSYSSLQEMIHRCEQFYTEVSERVREDGNHDLYEDERLFIDMINQLNRGPNM